MEHAHLVADGADGRAPRLVLGDRTRIGRFAVVTARDDLVIDDAVSTSDHVVIGDETPDGPTGVTTIESGAYLGCACVITSGVRIGAGAYVGEGAVVVDDVPAHAVVYGNPAVVVRSFP